MTKVLGTALPQLLGGQVHGGGADTGNTCYHAQTSNGQHQLYEADSSGTNAAGQVDLKACAYHPQKQIHTGKQQGTVKNRFISVQR